MQFVPSLAICNRICVWCFAVGKKPKSSKPRSGCPVSVSLEIFGDRWSLLIIRDLMVRGYSTFKEFQDSGENIASNILSDRLQRLKQANIISAEVEGSDARRIHYRLTEKGIDLAPVMLELLIWGARHEETGLSCAQIDKMEGNRQWVIDEARRRWREHDPTPLLPGPRKPGAAIAREANAKRKKSLSTSDSKGANR
jgi:DNA-binding HxlR family transcriptional regulator